MPHKSPFTEEIARDWEEITFPIRPTDDEQCSQWQDFFDKYQVDGKLPLKAPDASLITTLGWYCMHWKKDYVRANQLCELYLELPDAKEDWSDYVIHLWHYATTLSHVGEIERSIDCVAQIPKNPARRQFVSHTLDSILSAHGLLNEPHPAVRKAIISYLSERRGNKKRLARVATARSNFELKQILTDEFMVGRKRHTPVDVE